MHITWHHFPITEDLKLTKMMDIQVEWTYSHGTTISLDGETSDFFM